MELTGKNWVNYSTKSIDENNARKNEEYCKSYWKEEKLHTCSVDELISKAFWMKQNAELNHIDASEVPVFIEYNGHIYAFDGFTIGDKYNTIRLDDYDKMVYTAPDSRPEGGGEYWASRGPSNYDVSGFVKSKLAGERLARLVKYVLEKDEIKTYLDFREHEPNWIQFKFNAEEFNVEKLDKLSKENNGIITEQIIRDCIKHV